MADRSVSWDMIARDEATATLVRIGEELSKLGRQIKEASGTVRVDADTARADEKLEHTKRELNKVDGKEARARVNVDNALALAKIAAVASALAALSVFAVGALGGLLGVGAVVAGGFGVALGALSGVGDATKALGQQAASAGGSASQAADQIRRANEQVTASTVELNRAIRDEKVAQQDLTRAREDAARKLADLQTQTEDMALQQKQAALDVAQAKAEADAIANDPTKTLLERQQAQLTYQEKLQQQKDLSVQVKQLAQDKAAADKAGVEGSDQVQQAQRRLQDATQAVTDAQVRLKDAQIAAAQAGQQAAGGGAVAANTLAQAMANLSPAGQEFARFMRTFIDGPLKQLRFAAQEGFLPGIESGLKRLQPVMGPLTAAVGQFAGILGKGMGDLIPILGRLAVPFAHFATAALQGLAPLQGILSSFANQFGGVMARLAASGQVQKMMGGLAQVIGALLPLLPQLVAVGVPIASTLFPALAQVAGALVQALQPILPQLPQLAGAMAQLLVALAPLLPVIGQLAAEFAGGLASALQAVMPGLNAVIGFLSTHQQLVGYVATIVLTLVAAVKAWTVAQAALDVVLSANPIGLVVLAIAALVAGIIYAYKHSETFRAIVQAAGRIAAQAFGWVLDKVQAIVGWVKQHWPLLLGILTGPIGLAVSWIVTHWNQVLSFMRGIPDAIGRGFSGLVAVITWPFRTAFNMIADMWNATIGGLSVGIPGVASFSIPNIPHLAKGGIVDRPTLVLAGEAGPEAVVPLSRFAGQTGGGITYQVDVHVQNTMASKREIVEAVTQAFQSGAAGSFSHKGFRDAIGAAAK